jgi:hypothetical protein
LLDSIEQLDTQIDLLVGGFDPQGHSHLFELSRRGIVTQIDHLGYHAIGVGQWSALTTLYPVGGFVHSRDIGEIVYRLLSAKFAAESAPGVGRGTTAVIVSRGGETKPYTFLDSSAIEEAREVWKRAAMAPVPSEIANKITEEIQAADAKKSD